MNGKIWVLGGSGLLGNALKSLVDSQNSKWNFPTREQIDINVHNQILPFSQEDTVVDLVPPAYVRESQNLTNDEYHQRYTNPHLDFITRVCNSGVKKYIFVSSGGSVYGKKQNRIPFSESDNLNPISFYGESKMLQEKKLSAEASKNNVLYSILRPSNIFNENFESPIQKGLVGTMLKKIIVGEAVDIFGTTSIAKDYVASSDVAQAIFKSIDYNQNGIFNIGFGKTTSILEIIEAFEYRFKTKVSLNLKPFNNQDVDWFALDVSKAHSILDFKAKIDLIKCIGSNTNQLF